MRSNTGTNLHQPTPRTTLQTPSNPGTRYSHYSKPIVPLDLVEYIIDELRHDRAALQACNLTSRLWSHRARTHLHRTLTIEHINAALISDKKCSHHQMLDDLPVILKYADEVRLKGVLYAEPRDENLCGAQFWSTIDRLRHVRRVCMINTDLTCTSFRHFDSFNPRFWGRMFPAVENLSLIDTKFLDSLGPLLLASEFPRLQVLTLKDVKAGPVVASLSDTKEATGLNALAPRSVRISCHDQPQLVCEMLRHVRALRAASDTLEVLRLSTALGIEESIELATFFHEAETNLRDLHLVLQQHPDHTPFLSNMRVEVLKRVSWCIENCEGLDILRLGFRRHPTYSMLSVLYGHKKDSLDTVWQVWGEILRGLTKVSFRKLIFYVDARDIDNREALEDVLLTQSPLQSIEVIYFYVGGHFVSPLRMQHSVDKWTGAVRRLQSQFVVQLEFYHKPEIVREGWYIW
ncbi:hypothetical protein BDY19DRAFT_614000 [Irpex rosettiformis]|uniref:Uncharacterized protein n=1 Tax=Irpex rosettiformis TaxID=378272 RepID=A0ACB8TP80_9APHY|nr:hypothetical protein BDY19DRAFT_614000 [Irpex rosettiformis]